MGVHSYRAVFLDRDGVITRAIVRDGRPFAPLREDEFEILPDAAAQLTRLRTAGFQLIVVTNQPEISRGALDPGALQHMHGRLRTELPIDEIRTCPHDDSDRCRCRKPAPGLLTDAAADRGLSLRDSYMVGDRWRDIDAGRRAGCTTVFLDHHYDERQPDTQDATVQSLQQAVDWILADADAT